jgi:hypothetical protein
MPLLAAASAQAQFIPREQGIVSRSETRSGGSPGRVESHASGMQTRPWFPRADDAVATPFWMPFPWFLLRRFP